MSAPSVGRVVHYVSHGTPVRPDGTQAFEPKCRAAVIAEVVSGTDVTLCVLNPTGIFFHWAAYDPDGQGGSWHWPERVD